MVETEPGNMAGPTKQGIEYRITAGKTKVIVPVVASHGKYLAESR